jgi:hypothetical protein
MSRNRSRRTTRKRSEILFERVREMEQKECDEASIDEMYARYWEQIDRERERAIKRQWRCQS